MRFIKIFFGIILCIAAFSWLVTAIVEKQALWLIGTSISIVLAIPLFRKTKRDKEKAAKRNKDKNLGTHTTTVQGEFVTVQTEYKQGEMPDDIAKEMRKYYTHMQAQRDAEIMAESYRLASTTLNLETFCIRYDLAMQKAHTLLQAEQVGVRGIKKLNCHNACIAVINTAEALKMRMLRDFETDEIHKADALKTNKGKLNRYIKMLMELEKAEPTFMFVDGYDTLIEKVKDLIVHFGGNAAI